MGKTVLASWDADQVTALAERTDLPERTSATITELPALRAELDRIRERGYATDLGENEVGTVCVSAPIYDRHGKVTHALSISSIALEHPGTSIEELSPFAIRAADAISRGMGADR